MCRPKLTNFTVPRRNWHRHAQISRWRGWSVVESRSWTAAELRISSVCDRKSVVSAIAIPPRSDRNSTTIRLPGATTFVIAIPPRSDCYRATVASAWLRRPATAAVWSRRLAAFTAWSRRPATFADGRRMAAKACGVRRMISEARGIRRMIAEARSGRRAIAEACGGHHLCGGTSSKLAGLWGERNNQKSIRTIEIIGFK